MCLVVGAVAHAQPPRRDVRDVREAIVQFDRGRALLAEGKYNEACVAFARSQQLDPQNGTLYNLAGCYAKRGMLVAALRAYRELAERDQNARRRDDATRRATDLEPRIPKLRITAPSPGWTVTLNGADVSATVGTEQAVDPGAYEVIATAQGQAEFRTTVTLAADGATTTVAIRPTPAEVVDPFGKPAALPHPVVAAKPLPDPGRARRRYAIMAASGGGAFVALGLLFGKSAIDRWGEAKAVCGGDLGCATAADIERANALGERARGRAHAATGLVLGGGALIGLAAWLHYKAPAREAGGLRITPGTSATPAGVTIGGSF